MKTEKTTGFPTIIFSLILFLAVLTACNHHEDSHTTTTTTGGTTLETADIPDDFDYSTSRDVSITIEAPEFLAGAVFILENYNDVDSTVFAKGTFSDAGEYTATFSIPTYIDTILFSSRYVGLIDGLEIPITGTDVSLDLTPYYDGSYSDTKTNTATRAVSTRGALQEKFYYLSDYNLLGVPSDRETSDVIAQNLLDDINMSLPEGKKITDSHPEFLEDAERLINLTDDADVWVTFVSEGAGWKNALGYYSYPTDDPPASVSDIDSLKIIFPNASMLGSGGGLIPGYKVYLGRFTSGTTIGWFLVSNGWNGSVVNDNGNGVQFSNSDFNSESTEALRHHMVSLYDKSRSILLLGFEDVPRNWSWCDQDFNDAVFYATVNPFTAISTRNVKLIDAANDSDGDGINDELDDFPYDPNKSFNNYSNSDDNMGSLAFEDLWPSKGDYDFNDLVVDYKFNLIANAQNLITTIEADFYIRHIGAAFHNGFGFILPIESSLISSIENQEKNTELINFASNGTESDADETSIIVAEDTFPLVGDTINLIINFTEGISTNDLGGVPYNPFIIVNQERAREVHLPDMVPTSLASGYFGTKDDYSDASNDRYYKTSRNLPWAINVYKDFVIPKETVSIDNQYSKFVSWANSGGTLFTDWYLEQ